MVVLLFVGLGVYLVYLNINKVPEQQIPSATITNNKADLIRLDNPRPGQIISSPFTISGQARGNWFFEASFPVILTDRDGKIIAQGIAQAKSDWMTTEFVPFGATLTFAVDKNIYNTQGSLILKKDNPSGLSQNDDALEIPIIFGTVKTTSTTTPPTNNSGVKGVVTLGPTCPVERIPPDPTCAPKGYKTTIQVISVGNPNSTPFATTKTNASGEYSVSLPPGKYDLQPVGGNILPRCETKEVTVVKNIVQEVNLTCDTGIR